MPPEFTEEQYNQGLENQRINIRLDGIDKLLTDVAKDMNRIMNGIDDKANERRRDEHEIRNQLSAMDADHYRTFVKKSDLKLYAFLIVFSITATTGVIQWIGGQQAAQTQKISNQDLLDKVHKALGHN